MKKLLIAVLGLCSMSAFADNQRGFYAGAGLVLNDDTREIDTKTDDATAAEIFGGYKYNGFLGGELRVGRGVSAGNYKETATHVERDLDSFTSIYYKPEIVNKEAKLYALLGYTSLDTTLSTYSIADGVTTLSSEIDESVSGISYGIGIGYLINNRMSFNVEWRMLCEDLENELDTMSINIDYHF